MGEGIFREIHFTAQSLQTLFQDVSLDNIFLFLKEINTFGRL